MTEDFKKTERKIKLIEKAVWMHTQNDQGIWYIPEENTGELRAAASTIECEDEIRVAFMGSLGDGLGIQVLKSIAEYALEKNILITVYPYEDARSYYMRLGFKPIKDGDEALCIKPDELLKHPDYFE